MRLYCFVANLQDASRRAEEEKQRRLAREKREREQQQKWQQEQEVRDELACSFTVVTTLFIM